MKHLLLYILILTGLGSYMTSCTKDKGNYSYDIPPTPAVAFDTAYSAIIGDSLIIQPKITLGEKAHVWGYQWRVLTGPTTPNFYYNGSVLRMFWGLAPGLYAGQLTIIDSTNGMKYFYSFSVRSSTIYSVGVLILSQESGVSQLSFALPDSSIQTRIYGAINEMDLPPNARQIVGLYHNFINNGNLFNYWILSSQGSNPGVELDPNTLQNVRTLKDNFFNPPASFAPGYFVNNADNATMFGILNGQLWSGAYQTSPYSPIYDQFGLPATGDYQVADQAIFDFKDNYFLGYEINKKQVVAFTNYGQPGYAGVNYQLAGTTPFDPRNIGLDLLDFEQPNNGNCYIFGKNASDSVYEYMFSTMPAGPVLITPQYKRPFIRQDLITADTKWGSSSFEEFYFSSGSKIYDYNPRNQSVTPLSADFGGKKISMLKVSPDGNTLTTGVDGSVFFLDISVGKTGNITRRIDKIPGTPLDVYVRTK